MRETIEIKEYEKDIESIHRQLSVSAETGEVDNIIFSILRIMHRWMTKDDQTRAYTHDYGYINSLAAFAVDHLIMTLKNVFSEYTYHERLDYDELTSWYELGNAYYKVPGIITDIWVDSILYHLDINGNPQYLKSKWVYGNLFGSQIKFRIGSTCDKYERGFMLKCTNDKRKIKLIVGRSDVEFDELVVGFHSLPTKDIASSYLVCVSMIKEIMSAMVGADTIYRVLYPAGDTIFVDEKELEDALLLPYMDIERNINAVKSKYDSMRRVAGMERIETEMRRLTLLTRENDDHDDAYYNSI